MRINPIPDGPTIPGPIPLFFSAMPSGGLPPWLPLGPPEVDLPTFLTVEVLLEALGVHSAAAFGTVLQIQRIEDILKADAADGHRFPPISDPASVS